MYKLKVAWDVVSKSRFSSIAVEPSDLCNLNCPSCVRSEKKSGFLLPEALEKIVTKLGDELESVSLYGEGEPTLSPHLPDLTEILHSNKIFSVVSSNMSVPMARDYVKRLLDSVDLLKCCVDGYDQTSLNKYRVGSSFNNIVYNMSLINDFRDSYAKKELAVLVFRHVENNMDFFRDLARKHGFDQICWTLPIINWKQEINEIEAEEWMAVNPQFQRYRKNGNVWVHKTKRLCVPNPFICVDGTVLGCCRDRYLTAPVGNIFKDSIKTLKRRLFRFWINGLMRNYSFCKQWCWNASNIIVEETVA